MFGNQFFVNAFTDNLCRIIGAEVKKRFAKFLRDFFILFLSYLSVLPPFLLIFIYLCLQLNSPDVKELHIISFNYPYPPSYGGIIDVYYKIKALSDLGIKIHLHCFVDKIPVNIDPEVEESTESVFFYEKKMQ